VGVPVAIGPHFFNFTAITELLCQAGAAKTVADAPALAELMTTWLSDATERARIGEKGRRVVAANRGAVDRLMLRVEPHLAASSTSTYPSTRP
jgi:3-deoxy-D-manno-octulosonic-acid transferase